MYFNCLSLGTALIGYDTESGCVVEASYEPLKILEKSIASIIKLHVREEVQATFFVVGRTLEMGRSILKNLREYPDLFDIQQHTYSHLPLKSIYPQTDAASVANDNNVVGGTLPQIRREVSRTSQLLLKHLGVDCTGIRGPWGYYMGLKDKPEILDVLEECGIRFTSTYIRNSRDYFPVPMSVQPFTYVKQGHPGIMELPSQDWVDSVWRTVYGWGRVSAYARHLSRVIRRIAGKQLVWGTCFHDWSVITFDPKLKMMEALIDQARDSRVKLLSYEAFYLENAGRTC